MQDDSPSSRRGEKSCHGWRDRADDAVIVNIIHLRHNKKKGHLCRQIVHTMTKPLGLLSLFLAILCQGWAQPGPLLIKGSGQDLHIDHKVAPKEGIFAIGRLYNVHPKTIAAYNKLDMARGLMVGQVIHIPLTDTNFTQTTDKGAPIYYIVGDKETIQKVSNVNNRVPLQNLREWNKLQSDKLSTGNKLIVGFLVAGDNPSATAVTPSKKEEGIKEKKEEPAKETVSNQEPANARADGDAPAPRRDPPKVESKNAEPLVTRSKPPLTTPVSSQGYFKDDFDQQVRKAPASKTQTVTSGIFKMNNKGHEVKYYMLVDDVTPGTIVKLINPDNNKAVYAKVLGQMSGIRQNQGFDIRISNTAAATLGITDTDKFIVQINY